MNKPRSFKRTGPYRAGYRIPADHPGGKPGVVELRRPDKTIWQAMKDFINGLKINEKFKRKELLNDIYRNNMASFETSVDQYRLMLTRIKIIDHIDRGIYIKRKNIPESLNTKQLKNYAYNTNWKSWFTPLEMKDYLAK